MRRDPKGRLELTWMGKDSALIPVEEGKYDYAWVDPNDPRALEIKTIETLEQVGNLDGPTGANENLLIIGDSGDALRSLGAIPEYANKYRGQVKLVYIDPPFNTGQTFTHYADQMEHSIWLTMMRDRIRDIKPLLAQDASVWVHLDDAENHRMRVLLDEEFGEDNFVGEVHWQKTYSPRNDAKGVSNAVDVILLYQNTPAWSPNGLARTAAQDARYSSPDGDPILWKPGDVNAPGAATHQGMVYAIQHPVTGELMYPAMGNCWRLGQDRLLAIMQDWAPYELRDISDEKERARRCGIPTADVRPGVPAIMLAVDLDAASEAAQARHDAGNWPDWYFTKGGLGRVSRKSHLDTVRATRTPDNLWAWSEVGHTDGAKKEIQALFPGVNAFSTPKPERLLERVIHIGSNPGDIVLDCFAGSGTTAAVAHKMGRRWITVELLDSTARTFTIPRLQKVMDGTDQGGVSTSSERVAVHDLPEGLTPADAQTFNTLLSKAAKGIEGLDPATIKSLRAATKTRDEKTVKWSGGGGFTVAKMGPSMYEVDDEDGEVFLSSAATNGTWSKAVAGQLGFALTPAHAVFRGVRGRQRLLVVDGVADEQVVRTALEHLGVKERVVIVAKSVLPGAADLLTDLSPGSKIKKAPTDIFPKGTVK